MLEAKRVPVTYQYHKLNWDFIKLMAEIAHYASEKYGSAEQYADSRLVGEKSPMNHIAEHIRQYMTGEDHDHFKDQIYHLAAIAYNAMMEALYLRRFGQDVSRLNLKYPEPPGGVYRIELSAEDTERMFLEQHGGELKKIMRQVPKGDAK